MDHQVVDGEEPEYVRVPLVRESESPQDMVDPRDRQPGYGGQHSNVVPSIQQGVDDLLAGDLVAADEVGGVQVAEDQDFHAAASLRSALIFR